MTDILERLKNLAAVKWAFENTIYADAAAEIEQLREWSKLHSSCAEDYQMVRDQYDQALEKLTMARTFMTLEGQQAFDEEWARHMHSVPRREGGRS